MATNAKRERDKKKARIVSARKMADTSKAGGGSKAFKVPQGVSQFQPKKDTEYTLDIIPYEAGEGNPGADPGFLAAGRTYYTHRDIGPNRDSYACLAGTFNKPCPICEYRSKVVADKGWQDELAKALRAKTRQLWNVFDHNDSKRGVQIWEASDWVFGKHLFAKMDRKPEYETFASPDDGYTLIVGTTEEKAGSGTFVNCADIQFRKRSEPLDDDILAKATCLDEIIVELPYEKLKAIFESGIGGDKATEEDDDEQEEKQTSRKAKHQDEDDEDETDSELEDEENDEPPVKAKGKKAPVDDDDDEEEEDDEPAPPKKKKKPLVDEDDEESEDADEEDEDSEEEDDEPAKAKKGGGKDPTAKEFGLKVHDIVMHKKYGECDITKISPDGTSLTLEDEDGEEHRAVAPNEVKKVKTQGDDDDDASDDDDEPEENPAKGKAAKPSAKPSRSSSDDSEDDDEEPLEDEDDEEPAPPPKKKGKK
jgi:hypothetical protein